MKRTQIYFDKKQFKKLKHIAVEQETSVSEIIRELVDDYLEEYGNVVFRKLNNGKENS